MCSINVNKRLFMTCIKLKLLKNFSRLISSNHLTLLRRDKNACRYLSLTNALLVNHKYLLSQAKTFGLCNQSKLFNISNQKLRVTIERYASERPALTPEEASEILRRNEQTLQLQEEVCSNWDEAFSTPSTHAIVSVDSNHLASNTPIEDCLASGRCLHTNGFLFGVFDGHGGPECSKVVCKRVFDYIAASLLSRSQLRQVIEASKNGAPIQLIKQFDDHQPFIPELEAIYNSSLVKWCEYLVESVGQDFTMEEALSSSFVRLDEDIGKEVVENQGSPIYETLVQIANSGSVACVVHIDGPNLHIVNSGDCGAVLGEYVESHGGWMVERLTKDHNWENGSEVKRVLSEHPPEEKNTVIQNQRLLGMLMPLRAFGDFKFKWALSKIKEYLGVYDQETLFLSQVSKTPPYLTVSPEITYHRLSPHEKFLVMGSDGLWESLGALDIVTMVGHYLSGRQTLKSVELPRRKVSLGEISVLLGKRREGLKHKPTDKNAATHLIRHCLGSTDEGLDHTRLSHSLTLPADVSRYFRDDISIHVIFFDSNFIRVCPMEI